AAGVPYCVVRDDVPLYADFHAMRHTYISMLGKSGATIKEAQTLARHSDPKLTIGRYSHTSLPELGRAVEKMPDLTGPDTLSFPDQQQRTREALVALGLIFWAAMMGARSPAESGNRRKPARRVNG